MLLRHTFFFFCPAFSVNKKKMKKERDTTICFLTTGTKQFFYFLLLFLALKQTAVCAVSHHRETTPIVDSITAAKRLNSETTHWSPRHELARVLPVSCMLSTPTSGRGSDTHGLPPTASPPLLFQSRRAGQDHLWSCWGAFRRFTPRRRWRTTSVIHPIVYLLGGLARELSDRHRCDNQVSVQTTSPYRLGQFELLSAISFGPSRKLHSGWMCFKVFQCDSIKYVIGCEACECVCVLSDCGLSFAPLELQSQFFFFSISCLTNCFSGCNSSQMTEHKGSCFILTATICKWLRGAKVGFAVAFQRPRFCSNLFPLRTSAELPEAKNNKVFFKIALVGQRRGPCWSGAACQKSQLAGSALRNLVRQRPISSSDSAQLWLGAHRRGSWTTEIVRLEKKNISLHLDSLTCYCSRVDFLSRNSAHFHVVLFLVFPLQIWLIVIAYYTILSACTSVTPECALTWNGWICCS